MKIKKPTIILAVLIILSLSLAGSGFYLFQKEQAKNSRLQTELDTLKTKYRIAESKFEESKKAIAGLEAELNDAKTQAEKISMALQEAEASKQEAQAAVDSISQELESQKKLRSDLETVLKQTEDEMNKVKAELQKTQSDKAALEARMRELGVPFPGVELGKIVISPETGTEVVSVVQEPAAAAAQPENAPAAPAAGNEGKILVVNKDYNFAVINMGSKDDLQVGDVFSVFHDDKYVGDIKVEKLHDSMAAAGFVSADIKDKISEGDKVIKKGR